LKKREEEKEGGGGGGGERGNPSRTHLAGLVHCKNRGLDHTLGVVLALGDGDVADVVLAKVLGQVVRLVCV
jgi:hypothetical protein